MPLLRMPGRFLINWRKSPAKYAGESTCRPVARCADPPGDEGRRLRAAPPAGPGVLLHQDTPRLPAALPRARAAPQGLGRPQRGLQPAAPLSPGG